MQFKILNNKLLQFFRPGFAMFNANVWDSIAVYPISTISSVVISDRYVSVCFGERNEETLNYETSEEAKRAFDKLIELLSGVPQKPCVHHGSSPDLCQLK
jgi:hypothetical protein